MSYSMALVPPSSALASQKAPGRHVLAALISHPALPLTACVGQGLWCPWLVGCQVHHERLVNQVVKHLAGGKTSGRRSGRRMPPRPANRPTVWSRSWLRGSLVRRLGARGARACTQGMDHGLCTLS